MLLTKKDVVTKITMKMIFLLAAPSSAWQRLAALFTWTQKFASLQTKVVRQSSKKAGKKEVGSRTHP